MMRELEALIDLVLAAVLPAATGRRVGAPYSLFSAIDGGEEKLDWIEMARRRTKTKIAADSTAVLDCRAR